MLRFESTPGALAAHLSAMRTLLGPGRSTEVSGADEVTTWHEQTTRPFAADGMVVRMHWRPASLDRVLAWLAEAGGYGVEVDLTARVAMGVGTVRVQGTVEAQVNLVRTLRLRSDVFRHVVVLRADPAVKAQVDPWGDLGDAARLHAALKAALDPRGILNAGRGPV